MPDTGALSPGTMAVDTTIGDRAWSNPNNAKVSDNVYSSVMAMAVPKDYAVKIVKADGTIGSTNKADTGTNWPSSDTYKSYGASNDLWGESWTPADINDADFGAVLSVTYVSLHQSYYLKATNFGFSIPSGSTINGILVEIERKSYDDGEGGYAAYVDHIRITVYYTEGGDGPYSIIIKKTAPFNTLKSNLPSGETQKWGMTLYAPSTFTDGVAKTGTVTISAVAS
jgi:hypothetical protein